MFVVLHSAFLAGFELHFALKIAVGNRVLREKHSGRMSEGPKTLIMLYCLGLFLTLKDR